MAIKTYYYNQQLKKFMLGFANVFTGLQVQTGKNACGEIETIDVPIVYAQPDRVVAMLASNNTQNKQYTLPIMSFYMSAMNLAPERMHGVNQIDKRTYLEQGGIFPDDVKVITRVMPIPYNLEMELSIHTSNTDQMLQILEQIGILFDYDLQVQFNDAAFDWTKISKITLTGIGDESPVPVGIERKVVMRPLTFEVPIWLSPPAEIRQEIIKEINIRLGSLDEFTLNEVDEDGNLAPFIDPWIHITITGPQEVEITDAGAARPPGATLSTHEHYDPSLDDSCSADAPPE